MKIALTLVVVLLVVVSSAAIADFEAVGEAYVTNSWKQEFNEKGVGNFNFLQFGMITNGAFFQSTAITNLASGWVNNQQSSNKVAWAVGPLTTSTNFTLRFEGDKLTPLSLTMQAWDTSGATPILRETADATWNGSKWTLVAGNSYGFTSPVPEPGTIIAACALLGPAGLMFRRRRS